MPDEQKPSENLPLRDDATPGEGRQSVSREKEVSELLARARQTVKPLINREAANEVVSDDLLNFRMKVCSQE